MSGPYIPPPMICRHNRQSANCAICAPEAEAAYAAWRARARMVVEEGTPGALARFGARLLAEGFGAPPDPIAPLHPEWHPSHREIL